MDIQLTDSQILVVLAGAWCTAIVVLVWLFHWMRTR
jgi:hypothetical protein